VLLGQSRRRVLVVLFTERGEAIHLISARKATRRQNECNLWSLGPVQMATPQRLYRQVSIAIGG
jgi:Ribonuclease toxin, BrnT, of type II toxin-antitoxin system